MKLLLIEDNLAMQPRCSVRSSAAPIQVVACSDGAALRWTLARQRARRGAARPQPARMDGLQVLTQARAEGLRTPVLILTARGTVGDRILGLNSGADDYLPSPRSRRTRGTHSRTRAARRWRRGRGCGERVRRPALRYRQRRVYFRGAAMELAPREAALLRALLARPGRRVAKEQLSEAVFPGETVQAEAIEVVTYRLRKKLAATGVQLVTLRGLGLLLKAAE